MWMAGGGVKAAIRHGATDPTGQTAEVDKVHLHDLHATLLHLLGFDTSASPIGMGDAISALTDVHGQVVGGFWRERLGSGASHKKLVTESPDLE